MSFLKFISSSTSSLFLADSSIAFHHHRHRVRHPDTAEQNRVSSHAVRERTAVHKHPCSRGPDRVSSTRSLRRLSVHLRLIQFQFLAARQHLGRERLVQLEQVDVLQPQIRFLQHLTATQER